MQLWTFFEDIYWHINRRLVDLKYWVAHRTWDRYHIVPVYGMKPGYADKDFLMFHAIFGLLVDFVECECGWLHYLSKHDYHPPFCWRDLLFWKQYSSPNDGLAYLDWAGSLIYDEETWGTKPSDPLYGKPTKQAIAAKEQKELYLWYKNIRPARPHPGVASGWDKTYDRHAAGEALPENEMRAALDRYHLIETTYDQEDEDMSVRLMKIRPSLWT